MLKDAESAQLIEARNHVFEICYNCFESEMANKARKISIRDILEILSAELDV